MTTDLHLNQRQLASLGLFATRWGHLETEINFTISALGHIVNDDQTMPNRFGDRMKHWRRLIKAHFKDSPHLVTEAEQFVDAAKDLHDHRSMFLHGRAYGDPNQSSDVIFVEVHRHLAEWKTLFYSLSPKLLDEGSEIAACLTIALMNFNERNMTSLVPAILPRRYP